MTTLLARNRNLFLATLAFAVLSLLFGLWFRQNQAGSFAAPLELENGTVFPIPRNIAPFELVSAEQKPFTNSNLSGHWSVLFFGFTQCPQLCPTTLAILNETYQLLEKQKDVTLPQIVFISVDPERDTPRVLEEYLGSFNKHFVGATGTKEAIKNMTAKLNILYLKIQKPNKDDAMAYQIDHSGTLLLVNPEGQLLALFSSPHDASTLAKNIAAIEAHYSKQT
jgi:protein SCO1